MPRARGRVPAHARHRKVIKAAKGFYGRRKNTFRTAQAAVVKAGPQFEILAENEMNEAQCLSSPAISDGQIFIRTAQYLYCVGKRVTK